jgi:hypothetical protein
MIIWILFFIFSLIFAVLLKSKEHKNVKFIYFLCLVFAVFYFSAFRDNLGQDYSGYVYVVNQNTRVFSMLEPGYTLLVKFINYFDFSAVLFFVIFSLITNILVLNVYYRESRNFVISVFIFLVCPVLYFNSFNLVRQFASAAILLYSIKYVINRKFIRFTVLTLFASSIHVSSIVFLPLYFFNKLYPRIFYLSIAVFSFLIGSILKINLFGFLNDMNFIYSHYLIEDADLIKTGFFSIFLLISFIFVNQFGNRRCYSKFEVFSFNLMFILVVVYNLIPSFPVIFRLSVLFILVLPLFYALPIKQNILGRGLQVVTVLFFLAMSVSFFYPNLENAKVIPSKLLLPSAMIK